MPTFSDIIRFIDDYRIGDFANILGLAGLVITFINVVKSKTAAQQAKEAVTAIRQDISRYDTISVLSAALANMEEIKSLHRQDNLEALLTKYSVVRNALTSIRASSTQLDDTQKSTLTGAIQQFVEMEEKGERALAGKGKLDAARLNRIVANQFDKINELLIQIKNQIGR